MEKNVSKKMILLLSAVFLLLLFSVASFIYFLGEGSFGGVFRQKQISVSLLLDEREIFEENNGQELAAGDHHLVLKNREDEEVAVSLFAKGTVLYQATMNPGEMIETSLQMNEAAHLSALLEGQTFTISYVTDSESYLQITSQMPKGGDLVFFNGITPPKETLRAPFRLFGDFNLEEISFDTQLDGNIVLYPESDLSAVLYVSAPKSKVFLRNFSINCDSSSTDFYIKAVALNGKHLSENSFPIQSFDELARLADSNLLPNLKDGGTISILQSFSLTNSLNFENTVTLDFQAPVSFGENQLIFSSSDSGSYMVKTKIGTGPDAASLKFDAPQATLEWISDGTIPSVSTIEKYYNLSHYNGNKMRLGGTGTALPQVIFSASDNDFLEEDVIFLPQGNLLVGTLPFLVSRSQLDSAVYSIQCEEGSCTLEGSLSSGRIVSVDENGNERCFALAVNRDTKNIPVVYIETENGAEIESKTQYVSATFSLDGEDTAIPSQKETHIRIRGRGNSTWKWDKKPFKIHFDEPTSILGLPEAEEWALFANYADKSLMRNRLAQVMASELSFEYCPTQEYVDLFLNGEYLGIYGIGEHLESGAGRVEVDYDLSQMDCGYFLEAGGVVGGVDVKGMNYFHAGLVKFVLIKQPDYTMLTSEQFDYIKEYMLEANEAVKSGEGYEEYLDMDTLVDWMIMIELSNNTDCSWRRSTYFTKDPEGKLVMGPVWDFDLAFGNFSKDVAGYETWVSTSEDDYVGETWSTYLLEDPEFQARFRARWLEVRDTLLAVAMEEIDQGYEILASSAEENFQRWDILGKKVAFERHDTKNYKTYASQISYLKSFLEKRAAWIDKQVSQW